MTDHLNMTDLLARWAEPEGHPYKGSLIDWDAYQADPDNIGCMCAQGQALHLIGGWEPERIRDTGQSEADAATAKMLNISLIHAVLLRHINDSVDGAPGIVLTDPGKVLGDQWSKLLDFWWHLNQMDGAAWVAARDADWGAAGAVAWVAAGAAAGDAAGDPAGDAAGDASWEIQGATIYAAENRPFYFLPMFGFVTPDDIPARPANYGEVAP